MSNISKGYTDRPVDTNDKDSFEVQFYIDGLCDFLRTCGTPMTIAIQGDWGSGKTSMMNMIRQKVAGDVIPIWFNTWKYSQFNLQDQLVFSMLSNMISQLVVENDEKKKKFIKNVANIAKIVAVGTLGYFSDAAAQKFDDAMGGESSDLPAQIDEIKNLFQETVNDAISRTRKDRVVVFVDDLDRLQPQKAVELLEVMKLFLDCENCVFILAVDYAVVSQGIRMKFGDYVDEEKGKSFFDKIIQLPFKMPVAQYNVRKFVQEMLEGMNITDLDDNALRTYEKLIRTSIGFNPRSMKRLFNSFLLLNTIMMKQNESKRELGKKEDIGLNQQQQKIIFGILCMQMVYEDIYAYIIQNVSGLTKEMFDNLTDSDSLRKIDELNLWMSKTEENKIGKVVRFFKSFIDCLQMDDDDDLSDNEINNLKSMLMFSTITSVGASEAEEEDDAYRYNQRRSNRGITKQVFGVIKSKMKNPDKYFDMRVYQANGDREDYKFTYASGSSKNLIKDVVDYQFEFTIRHDIAGGIFNMDVFVKGFIENTSVEKLDNFIKSKGMTGKVKYDGSGNPRMYLFEADEEFKSDWSGYVDKTAANILAVIEKLI